MLMNALEPKDVPELVNIASTLKDRTNACAKQTTSWKAISARKVG